MYFASGVDTKNTITPQFLVYLTTHLDGSSVAASGNPEIYARAEGGVNLYQDSKHC
jgi:hypothetical protein